MHRSAQPDRVDAARKTHLGSSDLTPNAGNRRKNTAIQLFCSVNSFFQALGSEPLHLDARLPGWKGLDLGLIPKCDSNQIAFSAAGTPKSSLDYRDSKTWREQDLQRWENIPFLD